MTQSEFTPISIIWRSFEPIRTPVKSGLKIEGRIGLRQLIDDVEDGQTEFDVILVYDISRWGRFQDADESAYYEYLCRRSGISVHYCAEQFDNDGSPISTCLTSAPLGHIEGF